MARLTRRRFLIRSIGALALVAGCGGDEAEEGVDGTEDRAPRGGCSGRVVAHRYGRTEIDDVVRRLVPLTVRDQDTALALGVIPVAVRDGFYDRRYVAWPWVGDELRRADPEVLPEGELSFEAIAALEPNLIVGTASGITAREYGILSRIAPTVAQSGEFVDYGAPWQDVTRTLGRALCREEEAEERIVGIEAALADVRDAHPRLAGATGVVAVPGGPDGSYWAYGPQDSRGRFLRSLGLKLPREIAAATGDRFAATISAERLSLLDVDVLIWLATPEQRAALVEHPLYRRLDVHRLGRDLFLPWDGLLTAALTNTSALNLPFLLEELVPEIAGVLESVPATGGSDG